MDIVERVIVFLAGCGLGFVVGYICAHLRNIEEKLNHVDEHILHHELEEHMRDERGSWNVRWFTFQNIALAVVVLMVAYASFASQRALNTTQDRVASDRRELCESGQDSRRVQRDLVDQIYVLATASLVRDKEAPPLTEFEFNQYNAYIQRVNDFRETMYRQIRPSDLCLPYVRDDNVEPPTPPYPQIKRRQ